MPQLDYIIIFPQIFWFCIIFTVFYWILVYFFLPKFLITLKTRLLIQQKNIQESDILVTKLNEKQNLIQKILIKNLNNSKNLLFQTNSFLTILKFNNSKFDEKIAKAIFWYSLYYDENVIKQIHFFPKNFNLRFKN